MTKQTLAGVALKVGNLGLNMDSPFNRILRRAVVVGLIAFVAQVGFGYETFVNPMYLPVFVAVIAAIDKGLREYLATLK